MLEVWLRETISSQWQLPTMGRQRWSPARNFWARKINAQSIVFFIKLNGFLKFMNSLIAERITQEWRFNEKTPNDKRNDQKCSTKFIHFSVILMHVKFLIFYGLFSNTRECWPIEKKKANSSSKKNKRKSWKWKNKQSLNHNKSEWKVQNKMDLTTMDDDDIEVTEEALTFHSNVRENIVSF